MANTEKSEMLTIYDKDLNPIGERTRAEVHANGLLHQTIRLWTIQDGMIWFQKRSEDKALFPGRLDLSATGHIDPGEDPMSAVLRETSEEIGLNLSEKDVKSVQGMSFPFTRPDGKLDNEFANVFLYKPNDRPCFRISNEVAGIVSISLQDYDKLVKTGESVKGTVYECDSEGKQPPRQIGRMEFGPDDFCCLNPDEWSFVANTVGFTSKELSDEKSIDVYVDGSYNIDTNRYGYGVYIVDGGCRRVLFGDGECKFGGRNVEGEVAGAVAALDYIANSNTNKPVVLHYDYEGINSWANNAWKANKSYTQAYAAFVDKCRSDGMSISFDHTKGHSGIEGNEYVDKLAKFACGNELTNADKRLLSKISGVKGMPDIDSNDAEHDVVKET